MDPRLINDFKTLGDRSNKLSATELAVRGQKYLEMKHAAENRVNAFAADVYDTLNNLGLSAVVESPWHCQCYDSLLFMKKLRKAGIVAMCSMRLDSRVQLQTLTFRLSERC